MKDATGIVGSWAEAGVWPALRRSPFVVVLAGIDHSEIVSAALADSALNDVAMPRFEPFCSAPCDALLWRLETATGQNINHPGLLKRHWHRSPYAMTMRLVQYQPGLTEPDILDEGTLGTRGSYAAFTAAVHRLAMRFVRDAALGRSRGPAAMPAAEPAHGIPGWLDAIAAKWHDRLMSEWWSIGWSNAPIDRVLAGHGLGGVRWYRTKAGHRYLADPFPRPNTDRILCEEMPVTDGVGRIVSLAERDGTLIPDKVLMDDGLHHSYPCTFRDGDSVYCIPESTQRGHTRVYRMEDNDELVPICDVAPNARLADPTLFCNNGKYWIGCTDLDLGTHDNFCLLHAPAITGPWTPHARWPVKIDVRGARPAGTMLHVDGRLFRPAQNCAATYGAAVAIHEITVFTETAFHEIPMTELWPDTSGPFPHGLHTLVHDGQRFWIDGKRFVLDLGAFRQKVFGRASRLFSNAKAD